MDLHEILKQVVQNQASDVHFKVGQVPTIRLKNGSLYMPQNVELLNLEDLQVLIKELCTDEKLNQLAAKKEVDVSYSIEGVSRFRVNIYEDLQGPSMAFRVIPSEIPKLDSLSLPEVVKSFATLSKGLVLVTGPTGNGKSTTLASLIDLINDSRSCHIITIEDPIEFVHTAKKAMITQRQLGSHTTSFVNAIRSALRQDPDVIMIGEMRDYETISAALTLAETGHLVFSTLHTTDAAQTIDRIIDVFPPEQQGQIRIQLAGTLQGVVSQTLVPSVDNNGRVLACEVMVANNAIKNCINEGKTKQIYSLMQLGQQDGMQTFQSALQILENAGKIAAGLYKGLIPGKKEDS